MKLRPLFLVLTLTGLAHQSVQAAPGDRWERRQERREQLESTLAPQSSQRDDRLSPHEAARRAQKQNGGGRVLGVDAVPNGYRVKLVKDGEVRLYLIQDTP